VDTISGLRRSRQRLVRRQTVRGWNESQVGLEIPQVGLLVPPHRSDETDRGLPKIIRLHPVLFAPLNVILWGAIPLGYRAQLVSYPGYRVHTLPPRPPRLSHIPHPAIQNEVHLNTRTVLFNLNPMDLPFCTHTTNILNHTTRNGELQNV